MPWSNCGRYQISSSVATAPAAMYSVPSCRLSGPVHTARSPEASKPMYSDKLAAASEESAAPFTQPTLVLLGSERLFQSAPFQSQLCFQVPLATDVAVAR